MHPSTIQFCSKLEYQYSVRCFRLERSMNWLWANRLTRSYSLQVYVTACKWSTKNSAVIYSDMIPEKMVNMTSKSKRRVHCSSELLNESFCFALQRLNGGKEGGSSINLDELWYKPPRQTKIWCFANYVNFWMHGTTPYFWSDYYWATPCFTHTHPVAVAFRLSINPEINSSPFISEI